MTSSAIDVQPPAYTRAQFIRSRLASLLAVAPLGVWTVAHVWGNLSAFRGEQAWTQTVTTYAHPFSYGITLVVVFAPLLLHTFWGIGRIFMTKPNVVQYAYYANFKYVLQRLAAIGVLAFLCAHVWLAMLEPRLVEGHPEAFAELAGEMRHHGPTLVVYLLGTLGVAYHLANGLQTVAFSLGMVKSKQAQSRLEPWALVFFLVLLAMCWGVIYAFWRAGA